jgi:hypothetical protein
MSESPTPFPVLEGEDPRFGSRGFDIKNYNETLGRGVASGLSSRQNLFYQQVPSVASVSKRLGCHNISLGPIQPGSSWTGYQKCGGDSFAVRVTILSVDLKHSRVNGYLTMRGLCGPDEVRLRLPALWPPVPHRPQ